MGFTSRAKHVNVAFVVLGIYDGDNVFLFSRPLLLQMARNHNTYQNWYIENPGNNFKRVLKNVDHFWNIKYHVWNIGT